ncbi:FMN-binding negative transcriptional regulator [Kordiimonas pumila]|uniref:FMN-binding negative transcriptional regulator n=1 Tax=Kordiimonas pumila TaxID=2161677 RepID=A0ABV7D1M3_9PROT|nr:FMN-binding negative transcriptional regulator [Kordiimonas pumila]
MYAPSPFYSEDPKIAKTLVDMIVMGTLVTAEISLQGSPLPFMIDIDNTGNGRLISHMDKRNPLWKDLESGKEVLVIFWGPNAYISPALYTTTPRVPTWVYATVHIKGTPRLIKDAEGVDKIVTDLCNYMEKPDSGWSIEQVSGYKSRILNGIVGFEIDIAATMSQVRLAQQNDQPDIEALYKGLASGSSGDRQVAELMKKMSIVETTL